MPILFIKKPGVSLVRGNGLLHAKPALAHRREQLVEAAIKKILAVAYLIALAKRHAVVDRAHKKRILDALEFVREDNILFAADLSERRVSLPCASATSIMISRPDLPKCLSNGL